jgi:hypothetical protein
VNDEVLSEGLEKLNEAAWALHDLLYVGEQHPLKLRDDLPVDVTGDLIGVLHDINYAEKKIGYATRGRPVKEGSRG